jgi:hypothetical protein
MRIFVAGASGAARQTLPSLAAPSGLTIVIDRAMPQG